MNPPLAGPDWEFEPAEPDVGFLSDTVTHTCEQNLAAGAFEVQPAETADVTRQTVTRRNRDGSSEDVVAETTTLRCPACNATTAYTEHWPTWFFEEPRDGDE